MFLLIFRDLLLLLLAGGVIWGLWRYAKYVWITETRTDELDTAKTQVKAILKAAAEVEEIPDSKIQKAKDKVKRVIKKGTV